MLLLWIERSQLKWFSHRTRWLNPLELNKTCSTGWRLRSRPRSYVLHTLWQQFEERQHMWVMIVSTHLWLYSVFSWLPVLTVKILFLMCCILINFHKSPFKFYFQYFNIHINMMLSFLHICGMCVYNIH